MTKKAELLTAVEVRLFDDIYIDEIYVYFNNKQFQHNNEPYNVLKMHMTAGILRKFDNYIFHFYENNPALFEDNLHNNKHELIYKKHICIRHTDEGIEVYRKLEGNMVSILSKSHYPSFLADIANYLTWKIKDKSFASLSESQKKKEVREVLLSGHLDEIESIAKISNDPDKISFFYIKLDELPAESTPAWDNFIFQFAKEEYKELFMAWIYSVFYASNKGRQIIWIHGKGKSGKSTVGKAIYNALYGRNPCLAQTLEGRLIVDKFTMASFENCRFVTIGDCNDKGLLNRAEIKNLTGADVVSVRHMHQAKRSLELYSKILVSSNNTPYVNLDFDHELTRILYLQLDDSRCYDATDKWDKDFKHISWELKLNQELWSFIRKCEPYYYKWISPDNHNFIQPDCMLRDIEKYCEAYTKRDIKAFWDTNVVESPGNNLSLDDLYDYIVDFLIAKLSMSRVRSYTFTFLRSKKIEIKDMGIANAKYIVGYKVKTPIKRLKDVLKDKLKELNDESITRYTEDRKKTTSNT